MKTHRIVAPGLSAVLMVSPAIVHADVVLDWNEIMVTVVADQPPTQMNRFAAITHLAVFEAVNTVTGEYEPYLAGVNPAHDVSADAAAVVAAHGVLRHYVPDRAAFLDAARTRSLGRIAEGPAKAAGITIGEAFWTIVAEAKVEKVEDFFAMEQRLRTNETLRKTMADYHELVDRGRREIYRIEG